MLGTLQRGWKTNLYDVFQSVENELTVSSPYISDIGAKFLLDNVSKGFRENGVLRFVTDLSPINIWQGSTNPNSFKLLFNSVNSIHVFHLPRLHAKVYVSDDKKAIVTSGNLTAGGLYNNFEYGVFIDSIDTVSTIKNDLIDYGNLGAKINLLEIETYCALSDEIRQLYKKREKSSKKEIDIVFKRAVGNANDELIKIRLAEGALHTVFAKTIYYLLGNNGPLTTVTLHDLIEQIHPDLCDNTVDRIIDGKRFGKKWKHAVRTAQQQLKRKELVTIENGIWRRI